MRFEIEVRPRSQVDRTFVAYYKIEAATAPAAIEEAMRRLRSSARTRTSRTANSEPSTARYGRHGGPPRC
jgi:hypothetical protein